MNLTAPTPGVAADHKFVCDGYQILREFLSVAECESLAVELTALFESQQHSAPSKIGGVRNLFRLCPKVAQLANSSKLKTSLEDLTGRRVFPVRSIFFDKTPGSNWRVPWHQDLTIAVRQRIDTPGYEGWSIKDTILHVQPPAKILEGMVTCRLHLDDTDSNNGALKVIPGSHLHGKVAAVGIPRLVGINPPVVCEVPNGGVMVMRPLLLHASSPSTSPCHRRVLHLEYATVDLPNGLQWFDR